MKKNVINNIVESISKKIINEGVFDMLVLNITRYIVEKFKNKKNIDTTFSFNRGDDYAVVEFTCDFIKDETYNEPFSVHGESDFDIIELTIIYNPEFFPRAMNDLRAEIKETITHELEHIGQQNFEDMYVKSEDFSNYVEYLLTPQEIPAYVKGFITRSRTKRMTLDDTMEEWFRENQRNFDNKKDWKKVKKIWMDFANDMLTKQKVKKFK